MFRNIETYQWKQTNRITKNIHNAIIYYFDLNLHLEQLKQIYRIKENIKKRNKRKLYKGNDSNLKLKEHIIIKVSVYCDAQNRDIIYQDIIPSNNNYIIKFICVCKTIISYFFFGFAECGQLIPFIVFFSSRPHLFYICLHFMYVMMQLYILVLNFHLERLK